MVKRASGPRPRPEAGTGEWRNGKWTGKWEFSFTSAHPRPDGGRREIHRRGFHTRKAAKEELDRLMDEDRPPEADGLTVAMVVDDFVAEKTLAGRAPNTIAQHRWAAERAKELWGGWPAEQLTYRQLNAQYVAWQRSGRKQFRRGRGTTTTDEPLSSRSIEAFHRSVKAAFQLAMNRGLLPTNPAELATPPSVGERELRWWSPEQVGEFIAYDHSTNDLPTGMVDVLADTGARRGETCALRWSDLDLDAGTAAIARQFVIHPDTNKVEVRPTKRPRSKATISLHPDTVAAVRRRHAEQAAERLTMGNGWPGPKSLSYDCVFTWADGRLVRPDTHRHHRPHVEGCRATPADATRSPAQLRDRGAQGPGAGRGGRRTPWQYDARRPGDLRPRHPERRRRRGPARRRPIPAGRSARPWSQDGRKRRRRERHGASRGDSVVTTMPSSRHRSTPDGTTRHGL
jgi:integrase